MNAQRIFRSLRAAGGRSALLLTLLLALGACDRGTPGEPPVAPPVAPPTPGVAQIDAASRDGEHVPTVVFLGDSLTAGYGLESEEAYPALLEDMLEAQGLPVKAVNAGLSGDSTAGGLRRLDWLLRQKPDVVVVALGGNDGLRGSDLAASEANLRAIVTKARDGGAAVLLLGMLIPPNYGPEYTQAFAAIYPRVAKDLNVPLVPFMLEGVGGELDLNQPDGIHPTAEGQRVVAENVLPYLRQVLTERIAASAGTANAAPAQRGS